MKSLLRLFSSISLLSLFATVAICAQHNLRFVDESGKPIPDVVVKTAYTTTPPAIGGGTYELKSDADGRLSIMHPCGISSGSCCMLVSPVRYDVIGKLGYAISGNGTVSCGAASSVDLTFVGTGRDYSKLSVVSAANFREPLSSEMIVAAYGSNLAASVIVGGSPLPTILGNRRVFVRNSDGQERQAQLLFVSPGQINFIMPNQIGSSFPSVIVRNENDLIISAGFPTMKSVAPGIFTANQTSPSCSFIRRHHRNEKDGPRGENPET